MPTARTARSSSSPQPSPISAGSTPREIRAALGLTQAQMSRLLGISARKMSSLESSDASPKSDTRRRLTEVDRLRQALCELMTPADLARWFDAPNPGFDGSTPLQLVERGEIDRLWQMIHAVRTGEPG
jgi:transcriptional regulator with XRE-family HTH domain